MRKATQDLRTQLAIGDPHRGEAIGPNPHRSTQNQCSVRVGRYDALPLQQHPHLDHRQAGLHSPLDLGAAGLQLLSCLPGRTGRTACATSPTRLVSEQLRPAVAGQARLHRRSHIPAGRWERRQSQYQWITHNGLFGANSESEGHLTSLRQIRR